MPTAQELRGALHRRVRRVRGDLWGILQTTVAAGAAWFLANLLHPQPFFAPAAAVIAMGVSRGGRTVRAIELVVGVAVGIVVADVIVRWLGANTLVLMLVVGLSMAAALLFGAGQILVNQAAISGILVVATLQPGSSPSPARALDALIGGAVALLVGQVLFPRDPVARWRRRRGRWSATSRWRSGRWPRRCARATSSAPAARSTSPGAPTTTWPTSSTRWRWPARRSSCAAARASASACPLYAEAAQQMDYAVRNTRVLARRALSAIRRHGPAPEELADAVALLGDAVLELGSQLEDPERDTAARRLALDAAVKATRVLQDDPGLSLSVIIGQVRSTAIDLLRGSGMTGDEARTALDAAVERAGAAP